MYKFASQLVAGLLTCIAIAFLALLFVPQLSGWLEVDIQSSAIAVSLVLALLVLIRPYVADRAVHEMIAKSLKDMDAKS